jgi:hypothetical protein
MNGFGLFCFVFAVIVALLFIVTFTIRGCQAPNFEEINGDIIMHYDKVYNEILPTGDYRVKEKVIVEKVVRE